MTLCVDIIEAVDRGIRRVDAYIGLCRFGIEYYQDQLIRLRKYGGDIREPSFLFDQENKILGDLYETKRELEERKEGLEWYLLSFRFI